MCEYENCIEIENRPIYFLVGENGCWLPLRHFIEPKGYVQIKWKGKLKRLHRLMYEFINDIILPSNIHVRHKVCDNPTCFNPFHLAQGTAYDNSQDKKDHGRQPMGEQIYNSKLTDAAVIEIRSSAGKTIKELADKYGVGISCIRNALKGKTWKHVGNAKKKGKKRSARMPDKPPAKRNDGYIDKELLKITKPLN